MKYVFTDYREKFECGNPTCDKDIRKPKHIIDKLGFVCYECANMSFVKKQDAIIRLQERQLASATKALTGTHTHLSLETEYAIPYV